LAVLILAIGAWQGGLDIWTLPKVVLAVIGGWVSGWLVGKRSQTNL
jgi:hypothetical protein